MRSKKNGRGYLNDSSILIKGSIILFALNQSFVGQAFRPA